MKFSWNMNIKQVEMNRYKPLVSLFIVDGKVSEKKSFIVFGELLSLSGV